MCSGTATQPRHGHDTTTTHPHPISAYNPFAMPQTYSPAADTSRLPEEPSRSGEAPTLLRTNSLVRGFGRLRVLRGVDLHVEGGELLLVTGYNGSGKSTLLRCLAGLAAPQRGTIRCRVDEQELSVAERRLAVGYVAPDVEFYPELTTYENLEFTCRLRRLAPQRGRELLARVGLPTDRLAGALSSGMRQRLRWCWAVLAHPKILLLDEPLQNLDAAGRRTLLEMLEEHLTAGGLAVVANPESMELSRHVARHLDLGG